jgi:plasmid stabilization system protein ParE
MRIQWTQKAFTGLQNQLDYFAEYSGAAADRLTMKMDQAMLTISTFPQGGAKARKYRTYAVPDTTLVLVYRVLTDHVEIAACVDGRRNWRKSYPFSK